MKRALILTSNSLRHRYFVNECHEYFDVVDVIMQKKKNYYEDVRTLEITKKHFATLRLFEERIFSTEIPLIKAKEVEDINDKELVKAYIGKGIDVILLYGTAILKKIWLDNFSIIINLHLGLAPFYKGSATLFWPFYDQRLDCVGTTIHLASAKVDSGDIIQTIKPDPFDEKQNYYSITTNLIFKSIKLFPQSALSYLSGELKSWPQSSEKTIRISKKSDFNEEALSKVLKLYGNSLIGAI